MHTLPYSPFLLHPPSFIITTCTYTHRQCSAVQSSPVQISKQPTNPLRLGYHDNCVLLQLPWRLLLLSGGGLTQAPVPAGSACHWRTMGEASLGSGFTQCHGVADSGPNSGTSDALGHSGTGVVGVGGGVEEVLVVVVVVVVVRSRYH